MIREKHELIKAGLDAKFFSHSLRVVDYAGNTEKLLGMLPEPQHERKRIKDSDVRPEPCRRTPKVFFRNILATAFEISPSTLSRQEMPATSCQRNLLKLCIESVAKFRLGRHVMPKVKLNDVEIYYEEHGKGRPMVFLSETACDGEVWKINQVGEFSRDHRVIIHDYRGTGQSSKPSIDYTTTMFAEDVVALMDHLRAEDA